MKIIDQLLTGIIDKKKVENHMDNEKKEKLERLKKKNKEYQNKKKIEEDSLLNECITALSSHAILVENEEKSNIYNIFKEKIPFLAWGVDWKQFNTYQSIEALEQANEICVNKNYYIIWNKDLPIIKSDLCTITKYVDDISAVEPDTWLFSLNYEEIIEIYHDGNITIGKLN